MELIRAYIIQKRIRILRLSMMQSHYMKRVKINAPCGVILVCQKRGYTNYFNGNEINEAKGLDLVRTVFREIMEEDVQCIIWIR